MNSRSAGSIKTAVASQLSIGSNRVYARHFTAPLLESGLFFFYIQQYRTIGLLRIVVFSLESRNHPFLSPKNNGRIKREIRFFLPLRRRFRHVPVRRSPSRRCSRAQPRLLCRRSLPAPHRHRFRFLGRPPPRRIPPQLMDLDPALGFLFFRVCF